MRIIAGEARGRKILVPRDRGVRPPLDQTRGALFNILGNRVENSSVLDLFAGAGAFGLEAVSRGARLATFVERDPAALRALERNIRDLGFQGRCRVLSGNALHQPPHRRRFRKEGEEMDTSGGYNIIFLDPPFQMFREPEKSREVLERLEGLLAGSLRKDGILLLRHPADCTVNPGPEPADQRTFGRSSVLFYEKL